MGPWPKVMREGRRESGGYFVDGDAVGDVENFQSWGDVSVAEENSWGLEVTSIYPAAAYCGWAERAV